MPGQIILQLSIIIKCTTELAPRKILLLQKMYHIEFKKRYKHLLAGHYFKGLLAEVYVFIVNFLHK